ncbi:MAG TPA: cupin domain-containing protein [Alphaproteobacteria bacterium]|jgi:mannose-6-phosphate isomerase-like protein (cupin superfamily)
MSGHVGLIGGVGLTHLEVYEQRPAPDGIMSGCAHVHAVTDEAYYVISGTGALELHDLRHGFRIAPLAPGGYVQFSPGTLHRSVSTGALKVLAIMGNAGMPERGDARIYFGRAVDEDEAEFRRLVALPRTAGLEGALERRDRSVRAYMELLALWEQDRDAYFAELKRFLDVHAAAMAARREDLAAVVRDGPQRAADEAMRRIERLPAGLTDAETVQSAGDGGVVLGMCGILRQIEHVERVPDAVLPRGGTAQ